MYVIGININFQGTIDIGAVLEWSKVCLLDEANHNEFQGPWRGVI
jgi:hypothetical protein